MNQTDRPISEWTFQDLVSMATWDVIQGLTRGYALHGLIHQVLELALRWKAEQKS